MFAFITIICSFLEFTLLSPTGTSAVGSALGDLLRRAEERETKEECEELKYESLPLLRLTNK